MKKSERKMLVDLIKAGCVVPLAEWVDAKGAFKGVPPGCAIIAMEQAKNLQGELAVAVVKVLNREPRCRKVLTVLDMHHAARLLV